MYYDKIFIIGIGFLLLLVFATLGTYYHFLREKEEIFGWLEKLKELFMLRLDKLPLILEIFKNSYPAEKDLFREIVKIRSDARKLKVKDARSLAIVENYLQALLKKKWEIMKNLKGEQKIIFLEAKDDLDKSDQEILDYEGKYNKLVRHHNGNLNSFPLLLITKIFTFKAEQEWEA